MTDEAKAAEVLPMPVEPGAVDMPQAWNRQGDVVLKFAEDLDTRWRIAQMLVKSGMVRQKRAEEIMAIQLKAYEMGVPLMAALGGMYFIDGKVSLEGHLMDALAIQRCGVTKTIVESTDERCELLLHRPGWEDLPTSYTVEDAKRIGLVNKSNWKKHPKQMLYWRALSNGLRQIAPDYFGGTYTIDELEHEIAMQPPSMSNRGTDAEIDALLAKGTEPVEADPAEWTADEMDERSNEVRGYEQRGLVGPDEAKGFNAAMVEADWHAVTEMLDEFRHRALINDHGDGNDETP